MRFAMLKKLLVLAVLLFAGPVFAQSVQQSGTVTQKHVPYWVTSGVIADGGSATDSPITSMGVTNNGGAGFCVSSDRQTAAGRNQLCFGASTTGSATISLQNYGTAAPQSLAFIVNGSAQGFPTVSPLPVVVGDLACFATTGGGLKDCSPTLPLGLNAGNASPTFASGFNVTDIGSGAGGDWIASFERQGTAAGNESLIRNIHHSNFSVTAAIPQPIIAQFGNRGTQAIPVGLLSGDFIGIYDGRGFDTSIFSDTAAQMAMSAAGTWSTISHPSQIDFSTVAPASITPTSKMRIDSAGGIDIPFNVSGGGCGFGCVNSQNGFQQAGVAVPTISSTSTLTNKTLASSTDVIGGVTMTLGSDAQGDIYYRSAAGIITRLGPGTSGQYLQTQGAGANPQFASLRQAWGGNCGTTGVAQNSTVFCPAPISGAAAALTAATLMPFSGTVKNLYAQANTAPVGAQTYTYTVNKTGSDQTLTCQMTGAAVTCNDTAHSFTFAAGDYLSVKVAVSATATNNATHSFGVEIDNP